MIPRCHHAWSCALIVILSLRPSEAEPEKFDKVDPSLTDIFAAWEPAKDPT
jgi:hypothetical protein